MTDNTKSEKPLRAEKVGFTGERRLAVREIYFSAFEKSERMNYPLMLFMAKLWHTDFYAFYDGETLCGMVYMATLLRTTFIMFFAVDEKLRNRGFGARILSQIAKMRPQNTLLVSIEMAGDEPTPENELRARRKRFYQRCGYAETGYKVTLAGITQEILAANGTFSKVRFRLFFMLYSNLTMYPRIEKMPDRENGG